MSITTKKGDKGKTSLCRGRIVCKDDPRVEFCGSLDELCSFLGLSKSMVKRKEAKALIESIQRDLFVIGIEIATESKFIKKLKSRVDNSYVSRLEKNILSLEKKNALTECCFCLPGENEVSGILDITRTVARRLERLAVTLKKKKILLNGFILIYLNRLSDLLYLLARGCGKKALQRIFIKGGVKI
jgi:cob(I)alamin adenosyltransferase